MKIEKFSVKSCCGKMAVLFKMNTCISEDFLNILKKSGYIESPYLTKSGILYVDDSNAILTGTFGSNNLQVKCKKDNCDDIINNIEKFLEQL
jgi:ribosomal protein S8